MSERSESSGTGVAVGGGVSVGIGVGVTVKVGVGVTPINARVVWGGDVCASTSCTARIARESKATTEKDHVKKRLFDDVSIGLIS
jgi:hypothetical protein